MALWVNPCENLPPYCGAPLKSKLPATTATSLNTPAYKVKTPVRGFLLCALAEATHVTTFTHTRWAVARSLNILGQFSFSRKMRFAVAVSGSLPLTDSDSSKLKCSRAERCALAARQRTANATPAVRCFFAAGRIYTAAEQIIPAPLADVCGRCAGLCPTGVSTKLYKINLNLSAMMVKNA